MPKGFLEVSLVSPRGVYFNTRLTARRSSQGGLPSRTLYSELRGDVGSARDVGLISLVFNLVEVEGCISAAAGHSVLSSAFTLKLDLSYRTSGAHVHMNELYVHVCDKG